MKTNNATELNQPLYTPAQTQAFGLYLRQHKPAEVAQRVGVAERTVQQWISKFGWKTMRDDAPVELMLRQRIAI